MSNQNEAMEQQGGAPQEGGVEQVQNGKLTAKVNLDTPAAVPGAVMAVAGPEEEEAEELVIEDPDVLVRLEGTHKHSDKHAHTHTHTHTHTCMHTCMYSCRHAHTHSYMHAHTYTHACMHRHTHTHTHTDTHTHTHTHTNTLYLTVWILHGIINLLTLIWLQQLLDQHYLLCLLLGM